MNQIKAGAILNYVIIGLNTIVGLAYTPYMLRCLGQNEYGLYSLVASIIAYLTILDFGFGNAIIRYTAKFRAEGKKQEQWEMFGMFLIVYSIIGLLALCGGLCLYFNVDALFDRTMTTSDLSQARIMMLLLTLNLAFTFPLSIFGSIISAYENFVFQRIISILRIIISTGVLIAVLAMGYKAVALIVVQTIFNLLTLIINFLYCKRKLRIRIIFGKFDWIFLKEISVYSFWIFLSAIVEKIYWGTGQFVLGASVGTFAVAIYSIAILLQQMYLQFSAAIANVLLPRITAMTTTGSDTHNISNIFISTGRIQALVLSTILAGFIVFGKQFIIIWAGQGYENSFSITLIFFISLYTPLIQNTGVTILQARNQLKFRSLSYIAISVISLVLQIFLSEKYGAIGCAIAVAICLFLGQGIIMNIYYAKRQHIDILGFWKSITKLNLTPICFSIIGVFFTKNIILDSYGKLTLCIFTFLMLYLPFLYYFCMNKYEKNLIISPINKFIKNIHP